MKLLFVCRANVGRSQMAMALYNVTHDEKAESAGTAVDEPGQKLVDRPRAENAIIVMNELGIDMSQNTRRQLHEHEVASYDKIIVMTEENIVPDYLKGTKNVEFWDIDDPRFMNVDDTRAVRDEIKSKVDKL